MAVVWPKNTENGVTFGAFDLGHQRLVSGKSCQVLLIVLRRTTRGGTSGKEASGVAVVLGDKELRQTCMPRGLVQER
ncbi:hypothetical protein PanWU01x14_371390 [Parasponia andersonii]|uniref:Uncharacterized protein n=1 Tax=Parasponia andersonii TaxID=3476 RepID=A0A2P5A3Y7_PARAD|nr:hypothetical protein PanWU01x14_371390 [Parasponia andersonii]